jgi:hypothetical protein
VSAGTAPFYSIAERPCQLTELKTGRDAGERNCGRKTMDEIARWMDHGNGQHSVANGNGSV